MQACLSSSSPVGQSMKPSHRTWSSMQWYLPILSAVGQANLSIPSSETGHSVNRITLLITVYIKLALCLDRSTDICIHTSTLPRYFGQIGKIRGIGKTQEKQVSSFQRKNIGIFIWNLYYYFRYCVCFFSHRLPTFSVFLVSAAHRNKRSFHYYLKRQLIIELLSYRIFYSVSINCGN